MAVDGGMIDRDHRALIAIINEFEGIVPGPEAGDDLQHILLKLTSYTKGHFAREEKFQASIGYPGREAHQLRHAQMIESLTRLREEIAATAWDETEFAAAHKRMAHFLHDWLVNHIIKCDLHLKPFVGAVSTIY
jgi:hemerythrin